MLLQNLDVIIRKEEMKGIFEKCTIQSIAVIPGTLKPEDLSVIFEKFVQCLAVPHMFPERRLHESLRWVHQHPTVDTRISTSLELHSFVTLYCILIYGVVVVGGWTIKVNTVFSQVTPGEVVAVDDVKDATVELDIITTGKVTEGVELV